MKTFVLRSSSEIPIIINENNFEKFTKKQYPFTQNNRYYATCPECENPIQIRGLYTKERVYGAHTGKDIDGLNPYNQKNYEYCPRSVKGTCLPKTERKDITTQKDKVIYNMVRDYFDKIIYFAKIKFGFYITNKLAEKLLVSYCDSQGYLYPHSSINNIPYMLLYLYKAINPYGIWIKKGSALSREIRKTRDLRLEEIKGNEYYVKLKTTTYQMLSMMIWSHKFKEAEDGELKESVNIQISKKKQNSVNIDTEEIIDMKIDIREHEFINYINSKNAQAYREQSLMEMARKYMPPLN